MCFDRTPLQIPRCPRRKVRHWSYQEPIRCDCGLSVLQCQIEPQAEHIFSTTQRLVWSNSLDHYLNTVGIKWSPGKPGQCQMNAPAKVKNVVDITRRECKCAELFNWKRFFRIVNVVWCRNCGSCRAREKNKYLFFHNKKAVKKGTKFVFVFTWLSDLRQTFFSVAFWADYGEDCLLFVQSVSGIHWQHVNMTSKESLKGWNSILITRSIYFFRWSGKM